MAKTLSLTTAKVKFGAGKIVDTKFGKQINVIVILPNGEEVPLWGKPDDPSLKSLKKGQSIQLIQSSRGSWQLVQDDSQDNGNQEGDNQLNSGYFYENNFNSTVDKKQETIDQIEKNAELMRFCFEQAEAYCAKYLKGYDDLRLVALELFQAIKN